jgi:hypothetical protein
MDPNRGPFRLLTELDYDKRRHGLDRDDEKRYAALIEVLHKISATDEVLTQSLAAYALDFNSPGAAKALRGLRHTDARRKLVTLIEIYPEGREAIFGGDYKTASPALPLILSETTDQNEIKLLAKCSQFKRPDGSRTADDILFCTNAIEALSTVHSPIAQEALLSALTSDDEALYDAARQGLLRYCSDQTRALCRELLALPKRDAIKRLAKMEGKGGFAALHASLFNSSRYDRFFAAARTLTNR